MPKSSNVPVQVFSAPCQRVKMVDVHPKEPIFIASLYNGVVSLWNFETQALVRSFDTGTALPVRCVRFIPRLQSFVCGCDDMQVRVYNYNTMERTKIFQAHDDYIRAIAVHDQLPLLLTASDDMTVRQWDWSNGWALQMTYEGHAHYCMCVTFNPSNPSTFATGSLDQSIRVWSINNPMPNFQLDGHEDGVNCVEYYPRGDKPYLLSGSDDQSVRLWDYQTKACLQVFSFHTANVSAVMFHPDLPLIFTVAEDFDMKVISSQTFRLLHNLDHSSMQRAWSMASRRYENNLIVGYDEGIAVFKVGDGKPVFSMDQSGKVLVATENEISRLEIKGVPADTADGEVLRLQSKDLGSVETTAQLIHYGPGGQWIAVEGEDDYTIVSTLALRPKTYGKCIAFTWGPGSGSYAVLENSMTLKIYKNFKETATLSLMESADRLFNGPLLGVCSGRSVTFYDWATLSVIRMIDEVPKSVQWSTSGELVALATEVAVFLLKFNSAEVAAHLEENGKVEGDGLDFSFDLVEELDEKVREMTWVGDCLVYVNNGNRLSYYIGGETNGIAVLPRNQYLLGYLSRENRIFCIDKEANVTSYALKVEVIEYMAAIVREDYDHARTLLQSVDNGSKYKLAQFLEARGLRDMAFEVTTDDDHKFDLAVRLKKLGAVESLAAQHPSPARWKQLGDIAVEQGLFDLAVKSFTECGDSNGLLLIYTSLNDAAAISELGDRCMAQGKANVAFTCFHFVKRYSDAADLLRQTGRFAEAAFYARTYCPEEIEESVTQWKTSMAALPRVREAIASPTAYPNLFPSLKTAELRKPVPVKVDEQEEAPEPVEEPHFKSAESSGRHSNPSAPQSASTRVVTEVETAIASAAAALEHAVEEATHHHVSHPEATTATTTITTSADAPVVQDHIAPAPAPAPPVFQPAVPEPPQHADPAETIEDANPAVDMNDEDEWGN